MNTRVKFEDNMRNYDPNEMDTNEYYAKNNEFNENDEYDRNSYNENQSYETKNENENKSGEDVFYDDDSNYNQNISSRINEEPIYHFQTKIKNSGFWGKVKLRNGTWLFIVGLILFCISIVFIGVFWGFWYSHKLNYPMRILAITFLSLGISFIVFGLISNYIMLTDPAKKKILGSPYRKSAYLLFISTFLLIVASDLITLYYTYWHNRWVNTPLIILAIIFYFFGGIGFIVSLHHICKRVRNRDYEKVNKKKNKQTKEESEIEEDDDDLRVSASQLHSNQIYTETTEQIKKDFRKKKLKLTPRPVVNTSNIDPPSTEV